MEAIQLRPFLALVRPAKPDCDTYPHAIVRVLLLPLIAVIATF